MDAFGSLSGCFTVLSADRLIGADAPRTHMLCRASEPKHETYCDVRPGSILALYPVEKQPVLKGLASRTN